MSIILDGYPSVDPNLISAELKFPSDYYYPITIPGTFNTIPTDANDLLRYILRQFVRRWKWESNDKDSKRTLRLMQKVGIPTELKQGNCLLSLFSYYKSSIGGIVSTVIINNTDNRAFKDAPENCDFNQAFLTAETDKSSRNLIFSIEHKEREKNPYIPCDACNNGFVTCPVCGGTCKEKEPRQVGVYASGEPKLKLFDCPNCHGSGVITCPTCHGSRKIEVYAPYYSIVKSVVEYNSRYLVACYSTPWSEFSEIISFQSLYESLLSPYYKLIDKYGTVSFIKKNIHVLAKNNQELIYSTMKEQGLEHCYNNNIRQGDETAKGDGVGVIYARRDLHYKFPALKLSAIYNDIRLDIYLFECNKTIKACIPNLSPTSKGEYIKLRLLSLFHR